MERGAETGKGKRRWVTDMFLLVLPFSRVMTWGPRQEGGWDGIEGTKEQAGFRLVATGPRSFDCYGVVLSISLNTLFV